MSPKDLEQVSRAGAEFLFLLVLALEFMDRSEPCLKELFVQSSLNGFAELLPVLHEQVPLVQDVSTLPHKVVIIDSLY